MRFVKVFSVVSYFLSKSRRTLLLHMLMHSSACTQQPKVYVQYNPSSYFIVKKFRDFSWEKEALLLFSLLFPLPYTWYGGLNTPANIFFEYIFSLLIGHGWIFMKRKVNFVHRPGKRPFIRLFSSFLALFVVGVKKIYVRLCTGWLAGASSTKEREKDHFFPSHSSLYPVRPTDCIRMFHVNFYCGSGLEKCSGKKH